MRNTQRWQAFIRKIMTLQPADVAAAVTRQVSDVQAIDVHTHLLPPSHGSLLLYGIDEVLTYHYLVAELFMVMPLDTEEDAVVLPGDAPTTDEFFAWSKPKQAGFVFDELFVKRTPLSEACRGVITCLSVLGLGEMLKRAVRSALPPEQRLSELRTWFAGQKAEDHLERVFQAAGLRYAVMTNVPFAREEAVHFFPKMDGTPAPPISSRLKTALRVDPLLTGNWSAISAALLEAPRPYELTIEGAFSYISDWVALMKPLYLMASTPGGFSYRRSRPTNDGGTTTDGGATVPTAAQLLEQVTRS